MIFIAAFITLAASTLASHCSNAFASHAFQTCILGTTAAMSRHPDSFSSACDDNDKECICKESKSIMRCYWSTCQDDDSDLRLIVVNNIFSNCPSDQRWDPKWHHDHHGHNDQSGYYAPPQPYQPPSYGQAPIDNSYHQSSYAQPAPIKSYYGHSAVKPTVSYPSALVDYSTPTPTPSPEFEFLSIDSTMSTGSLQGSGSSSSTESSHTQASRGNWLTPGAPSFMIPLIIFLLY